MRYIELPWPLEGWTADEDGWLHSPAGYRTTPQRIEGFCWLFGLHDFVKSQDGHRLMFADTPLTEPLPRCWDWKDVWVPRKSDIKVSRTRRIRHKSSTVWSTQQRASGGRSRIKG